MGLLRRYLRSEIAGLNQNGVRLRVIGQRDDLSKDIIELIEDCEKTTESNTTLNLIIALSYGGRAEIASATRKIAEKAIAGSISTDQINEQIIVDHLDTAGIPDPDLLVRTSGEKRISNFLLWQLAYAEFVFTDTLWPDFSEQDYLDAISEFSRRERRFGASGI